MFSRMFAFRRLLLLLVVLGTLLTEGKEATNATRNSTIRHPNEAFRKRIQQKKDRLREIGQTAKSVPRKKTATVDRTEKCDSNVTEDTLCGPVIKSASRRSEEEEDGVVLPDGWDACPAEDVTDVQSQQRYLAYHLELPGMTNTARDKMERRAELVKDLMKEFPDEMKRTYDRRNCSGSSEKSRGIALDLSGLQREVEDTTLQSTTVTLIMSEPSGYIGFGDTLSPLILIGVFPDNLRYIYMDGVEVRFHSVSKYSIHITTIPAHPNPPSSLFYTGTSDDAPDEVVSPVSVTFSIAKSSRVDEDQFVNRTLVMDGEEGRTFLARSTVYTPVLRFTVSPVGVMRDAVPYFPPTTYRVSSLRGVVEDTTPDRAGNETWLQNETLLERLKGLNLDVNDIWVENTSAGVSVGLHEQQGSFFLSEKTNAKIAKLRLAQMLLAQEKEGNSKDARNRQEEESMGFQRFSARVDSFTFSPVRILEAKLLNFSFDDVYGDIRKGDPEEEEDNQPTRDEGGSRDPALDDYFSSSGISILSNHYLFAVQVRVTSTEHFASNATLLWSVGEVTGDVTTATVTASVVPYSAVYALYHVLPTLNQVAMFQSLAAARSIDYMGVRFTNEDTLFGSNYHILRIQTTLPRIATGKIEDMVSVRLHRLRMPTLSMSDYTFVPNLVDASNRCIVLSVASQEVQCYVEFYPEYYEYGESYWDGSFAIDPLETCGAGVVVYLYLENSTGRRLVEPFPVIRQAESVFFVRDFLQLYPDVAFSLFIDYLDVVTTGAPMYNVTMQFSFVYMNLLSGRYRVHCYGDGIVRVDALVQGSEETDLDICHTAADGSTHYHIRSNYTFARSSVVVFNLTCTYPLEHIFASATSDTAACGISLEVERLFEIIEDDDSDSMSFDNKTEEEDTLRYLSGKLEPYIMLQIETAYQDKAYATEFKNITETISAVSRKDGVEVRWLLAEFQPIFTDSECRNPELDSYQNSSFIVSRITWGSGGTVGAKFSADTTQKCLRTVTIRLNETNQCDELQFESTVPESVEGVYQRSTLFTFYCGSRSFYMDPISPHRIRVPLTEIPKLLDLDTIAQVSPTDNTIFQYCVDVLIDDKSVGITAAATPEGPLIYTMVDSKLSKKHYFTPYIGDSSPTTSSKTTLTYGDVYYMLGSDLVYRASGTNQSMTAPNFLMNLALWEPSDCSAYLVVPSNLLPQLTLYLVNDTTLALDIDDTVPAGWFLFTVQSGYIGEVWVECDVSFRVHATPTRVFNADVSDLEGKTMVTITGHNMPLLNTAVYVGNSTENRIQCEIADDGLSTTGLQFYTPTLTLEVLEKMAIGREDGTDFFKLPIMVEILAANHSYDDPPNQTVFQLLTTDNVKDGANWFYIPYNVASSSVTKVSPSLVSAMNPAPSFRIWGTSLFNNILICDSARACLSCTPSLVGEGFIDCTLAAAIPAGNYSLYLSDTPNYPAPNIVIQSTASITAISPNRMYIYGGAEMRLEGVNLFIEDPSRIRVKLNIGSNSFYLPYVRYLPVKEYGEDFVTFTAPDFSTGIPNARFMEVNLVFDDGMEDSSLFCNPACSVKILSGESVPAITSFYPIQGQAPLLITVSGHGFTMLPASPDKEDSYIDVGSGLCRIVEMLNTELVCQLETPCANNYANSSLHIFSKTFGRSAPFETTARLFFLCTMSVRSISQTRGSTAGGQRVTIHGEGFPSLVESLSVYLAGLECNITSSTSNTIECITSATQSGGSLEGAVVVMNTATDGRAECCSYTYDPDLTPKIDVVTPLFGIGLSHTSIYGRGFMGTYAPSKQSAATESISDVSMYDCTLAPNADKVKLYVQFGNQLIPATVYSDTCARLIFPKNLFGTSYIFLYNAEVGLSLPYTDGGLSVNMLPAIVLPSSGGFASEVVIRLVGTTMVNLTVDINELIYINVCGKRCTITNITEDGEVECSVPQYMDVDFIHNLYPSLFVTFPVLYTGYRVHYWAPSFTDSRELYLSGQSPEWGSGRLFSANATPSSPVRSRFVYVLEAEMHSRLLLYSVTITLSPVTDAQLDFSSSTCRLQMAVPEAESHDLFSEQANPSNTTMWDDSKAYYWPPLSIGDNSIIFTTDTPVGSYILITCTGLPEGVLRLEGAQLRAYQVGLQDSGGACPVDMVSQQRDDQPITHSCPSRDGHACTMFRYDVNSTPIVLKFSPSSMLASSRNEIVTISGVNLGSSTAEIDAIVLDEAYCDVVSVEDTEIQCRMRGFITTPRSSFIRYNNATKGNAMFLVPQPFYSTTGWSSYASWMRSGLPTEEAEIEIGVNSSVLLDTSPPHLFSIKLDGVLVVSDEVDIELTLNQLIIGPTGVLVAGTPTSPHQHKFTLTLSRLERNQAQVDDVTAMQADTNEMPTDKLLHVQSGGTLMLHGLQHIYEKSTLLATANKGDTSVLVRGRMDWEIGDTILVTTPTVFASDEERAVIRSLRWVNDATVIGLVDRLNYTHEVNPFRNTSRPFDEENDIDLLDEETKKAWYQFTNVSVRKTSEVILLSRSIVVQGDEISASSAVGATIWIQDSVNSRFSNVEFRRIGKRGSLKGYGVFFDTCLYSHPTSLMDGCTVHDSYNRGVVLSQTENAIISRLITFFIEGFVVAAIGTYHKSLVIQNSYLSGAWSGKGSTDTSVSIVYLSYPDIVFANNIVRLSEGHGVWYSLRHQYANSAIRTCPTTVPLNDFANNTIFACRQHGLVIYPIHQALSRTCATNVFEVEGNSGSAGEVLAGKIENSTIFMCGSYGISLPFSSGYTLSHLSVTNCNDGAVATSFATTIQQILFTVLWGSDPGGEVTTFSTTLVERTSLLTLLAEAWKGGNEEEQQTTVKHTVGLRSLHGGYINVMYCVIGNFTEGAALWLSTSTPQPSFSLAYADVVSASNQELYELHNSILSVNLQSVHFLGKNFLNASIGKRTNVHDVDGTLTHLHEDVFILPNSPFLQSTSFCRNASDVKRADGGFVVFSENVYVFSFSDFWANMVAENMSTLIHDYMLCYSADRNFITFSVHQALTAEERLKETELQKSGGESLWCSRAVVVLQHEYGKISFEVDLLPVGVAKDPTRLLASEMVDTTPASALFIFLADRNNPFTEDGVVDNARGVAATNASFHFRYLNGSSCLPTRFWYSGSGFSQSTQENVKVRVEIGSSYWLNLTGSDTGYVWYKQEEEQVPLSVMKLSEREDNSSNSSSSSSSSGSESSSDSSSSGPGEVMVTKRTTYASIDFLYYMQHSINNNLTIALTVPHLVGGSILIVKCKEGERCLDSIMPSYNAVAAFERNISEPYKDWFSSKSWLNECAPWLGEKDELDEREAFLLGLNKEQVYAVDMETRVRLNRSANVPGVLHINGELLIEGDEGSTDVIVLRAESMIVFGNLTVRSPFAHSPKIRIELGYVSTKMMGESTLPVDCTSRLPLRVSPSKRVFCGQTLFLGHVLMLGRQSPTVYRSTKVMKSGSKSLPVLEAIRNEESYNTTFAPFYDFFDVPNASALVAADTKAWTAGDTLGVTSSSGRLQEAEMVVAAEDKEQQITSANISQTTEATTLQDAFLYTHGFEEEDYTAYSEVVALSKNIEMHCLITPEQAERYPDRPLIGCSIVLIFSILLNQTSDFSAVGTSFHGFGRGGQYEVPPSPSTPPLEDQGYTWEYLLNKETFIPGILAIETTAVSILSSTFVDSYGPSVYINNTRQASNIAFVFIDSVVWNGQGGGIRVDSGYQELLLQASMGLQEKSIIEADLSQFADLIGVKNVQVYILYSLVTGTTYYRGGSRQTDPYTDILSLCSFLANGTNIRIYKSIAAGSEGEGFCVDWREASLLESNVAHGNVNGMFLFTSTLLSVEYILGGTNTSAVISESNFVLKGLTAYSNILTGLYSSSHRNITVLEGKFFENTVSASLSISSKYDSGTNIIRNTSFGCPTSCEGVSRVLSLEKTPWPADMPANFSVFMRPSVLCAAVGLVPSYKTVTLSYSRKDYLLNSQDNLYEYPTSARYGLYNITASGIGDIQCKGSTPLQSTLLAGLNGMSSSASIYEVEANNISYVSHPAVQWTAQSAVAVTAGRYTFNYADTVFYDADGSLFHRRQCNYVVARSTLAAVCSTQAENPTLMACCHVPFVQIRVRSLDDRQKGLSHIMLRYAMSYEDSTNSSAGASMGAGASTYVLPEGVNCSTAKDITTYCSDDPTRASYLQIYKSVPRSAVLLEFDPDNYPDVFEVGSEGCRDSTTASGIQLAPFTKIRLKLLDPSKTITVWDGSFSVPSDTMTNSDQNSVQLSTTPVKWYVVKEVDPVSGSSVSYLDLSLQCGTSVTVHQLAYGELLVYSEWSIAEMERQFVQWNNNFDSADSPINFNSNLTFVTTQSYPDHFDSSRSYLRVRAMRRDWYLYNVQDACREINQFISQFSAQGRFKDSGDPYDTNFTGGNIRSFHLGDYKFDIAGVYPCINPLQAYTWRSKETEVDVFFVWKGYRLTIYLVIIIVFFVLLCAYMIARRVLHKKFKRFFATKPTPASTAVLPTSAAPSVSHVRTYAVEDGSSREVKTTTAIRIPDGKPTAVEFINDAQGSAARTRAYCASWKASPKTWDTLVEHSTKSGGRRGRSALEIPGWVVPPAPLDLHPNARSGSRGTSRHTEEPEEGSESVESLIPIGVVSSNPLQSDQVEVENTESDHTNTAISSLSTPTAGASKNFSPSASPLQVTAFVSPANAPTPTPILASRYTGTTPAQRGAVTIVAPLEHNQVQRPSLFEDGARRRWINTSAAVAPGYANRGERPERPQTPMILQSPTRKRFT